MSIGLVKKSVRLSGHATSLAMEQAFWDALKDLARGRGCSMARIIAEVDQMRDEKGDGGNLASALRVYLLRESRKR